MLTDRRSRILQSLIQEYVATAVPVSSESVARNCGLRVSSATVRNEMAQLEEEGYIVQPHTSAGRVPSAKGYRYYVEILLEEHELSQDDQRTILHQFSQTGKEIDEWIQLTASILSRMLRTVAIVTSPRLDEPRVKLVELVSLRDFLALLLVVFEDASFRQRKVSFDAFMSQESLNTLARRFTDAYRGLTGAEIRSRKEVLSLSEESVVRTLTEAMDEGNMGVVGKPYFNGLSQILSQPEFSRTEKTQLLMQLLEGKTFLSSVLAQAPRDEKLRVIIGEETNESALQGFSVVLGRYGLVRGASGVIGVVGPTRMPYERAVPAVRFLSVTMGELLHDS